jgi:hypothetical protein
VPYAIGVALIGGFAGFALYRPGHQLDRARPGHFFQDGNPFRLQPLTYTIMVIVIALVIDQIFDNLVAPRIMASSLKVHPAFVLIAAILAANLFGLLGVIAVAPPLADPAAGLPLHHPQTAGP